MAPKGGHLNKRKQEPQKHSGSKTEKKKQNNHLKAVIFLSGNKEHIGRSNDPKVKMIF